MSVMVFVDMARKLAQKSGKRASGPQFIGGRLNLNDVPMIYEDSKVKILVSSQSKAMEVRYQQDNNPVLMTDDQGEVYRQHGALHNVLEHVIQLATKQGLKPEPQTDKKALEAEQRAKSLALREQMAKVRAKPT